MTRYHDNSSRSKYNTYHFYMWAGWYFTVVTKNRFGRFSSGYSEIPRMIIHWIHYNYPLSNPRWGNPRKTPPKNGRHTRYCSCDHRRNHVNVGLKANMDHELVHRSTGPQIWTQGPQVWTQWTTCTNPQFGPKVHRFGINEQHAQVHRFGHKQTLAQVHKCRLEGNTCTGPQILTSRKQLDKSTDLD